MYLVKINNCEFTTDFPINTGLGSSMMIKLTIYSA